MSGPFDTGTRARFEAAYQALVQRALAGERFTFPAALPAPALPPLPRADAERADTQRWALNLSRIADPKARQARLATAPIHWQPIIRHHLAWRLRLGRAAVFDRRHTGYNRKAVNSLSSV